MQKSKLKITIFSVFFAILFILSPSLLLTVEAKENKSISELELIPGGTPFGVKIASPGLMIVKFTSTKGPDASAAYLAGMREGDIITKVNDVNVNTIDAFINEVNKANGENLNIVALRNNKEMDFIVKPKYSKDDGRYKTGIWVKDSTTGIGTITFINPENSSFGGLGHAICDSISGRIVPLSKGIVMDVNINGVIKGQSGAAGELKGAFLSRKIGTLTKNCQAGVFGIISNDKACGKETVKVCPKEELKPGDAYILTTLDGNTPQKYKIKIYDIDQSNSSTKNFKIKVTDPELIKKTGGIVQGMSGSPIIQNGRLVGAVTHVLINDPTSGYGIFIENMLNSMPEILK